MKKVGTILLLALFSGCEREANPISRSDSEVDQTSDPFSGNAQSDVEFQKPSSEDSERELSVQREIRKRLNQIILPSVEFEDAPFDEVMEFLTQKSIEFSPEADLSRRGISFVIENGFIEQTAQELDEDLGGGGLILGEDDSSTVISTYRAVNIPLGQALSEVCALAGFDAYIANRILILPKGTRPVDEAAIPAWPEQ